jgi:hypothetical protein
MTLQEVYAIGPHCIRTYTGKVLDLTNPHPDSICIEDIARGLSHQYRFNGHAEEPMTVAQHSVLCASEAPWPFKMAALLHDASEAYIGDMPAPIKSLLTDYAKIEYRLMEVIAAKFSFQWPLDSKVKQIDKQQLQYEWNENVLGGAMSYTNLPWSPHQSHGRFIKYYNSIICNR